jgi:hypothetical protein
MEYLHFFESIVYVESYVFVSKFQNVCPDRALSRVSSGLELSDIVGEIVGSNPIVGS